MSNSTGPETPLQEAVPIISILTSVGCYIGALNQVAVITAALWWVAARVYEFLPALARLPGTEVPILAASAAVGIALFVFTIPAGVFAGAGYASMDRQTIQLKRFREKRKNYKRNHDDFSIG